MKDFTFEDFVDQLNRKNSIHLYKNDELDIEISVHDDVELSISPAIIIPLNREPLPMRKLG